MTIQAMKQQLIQSVALKQKFAELIDVLIEMIVRFTDYTVYRHITAVEAGLFGWAFLRAGWYLFFGVVTTSFDYFFSETTWTVYFVGVSLIHLTGFFVKDCRVRLLAIYGYALAWGVLLILAVYSRTTAPAPPGYFMLFILSFLVLVRLSRKQGVNGDC